ncbi:hypothetical protein D3C86_2112960 [compost metagenome]
MDSWPYTSHDPVVASGSLRSKYTDSSPYLARGVTEALLGEGLRVWKGRKVSRELSKKIIAKSVLCQS